MSGVQQDWFRDPLDLENSIQRDPPELCTVVEASIILNVRDSYLRNLLTKGLLPYHRLKSNSIRIKLEDIRAYELKYPRGSAQRKYMPDPNVPAAASLTLKK